MGRHPSTLPDLLAQIDGDPVVSNYLVIPDIVGSGALTEGRELPWGRLGGSLNLIRARAGAPSDIHLFVGGIQRPDQHDLVACAAKAINRLSMAHYRDQIVDLSSVSHILSGSGRQASTLNPSVAGIVIGIQFSSAFEAFELSALISQVVLGVSHLAEGEGEKARIPAVIAEWLRAYGGARYGGEAWFFRLPSIRDAVANPGV